MKILATGANGFVGRALCAESIRQGLTVLAALREESALEDCTPVVIGAIDNATNWSTALSGVDIVVHLAARVHVMHEVAADPLAEFRQVNVEGTLNLARQAIKAGVTRFIFVSSIGVHGNLTKFGQPFYSTDTPNPHDPYSISKYEAEQALQKLCSDTAMELVIIRPPLVYGSNAPGNFKRLINSVKLGIPLPLGAIHNKRSFVFVGNLVSLILKCIDHPQAANQVFLVSDGHDLSTTELLQACAVALGVKPRLLPVPQKMIEVGAALVGKKAVAQRLCGNLQVDIEHTRRLLAWEPPYTVADGLKATALGLHEADH
jgi:nucleoside-diphosphate-sugar epimerase